MAPHQTRLPPRGLGFSARPQDGFTIITLTGELDIASAPLLREQLLGVLRPHASRLIIDLANVSFCDASGLAVLVSTGRRAGLLGGALRLAAPALPAVTALRTTGLGRQFDIFTTVRAATTNSQAGRYFPGDGIHKPAPIDVPAIRRPAPAAPRQAVAAPDADDLRGAVTALLAHAAEWRDADPNRRFTLTLRALARAHAGTDHTALTEAARSLLAALICHPLTHSAAVAATARELRRVMNRSSYRAALN